jgi:hypothetical protein
LQPPPFFFSIKELTAFGNNKLWKEHGFTSRSAKQGKIRNRLRAALFVFGLLTDHEQTGSNPPADIIFRD